MKHLGIVTGLLIAQAALPPAPAAAEVYIDKGEKVDREQRDHYYFAATKDPQKFKLTVSFKAERQGHLRIYFYEPSPMGGWAEVQSMRVLITRSTDEKSTTFELPADRYRVRISARRGEYGLKLEDAEEEKE